MDVGHTATKKSPLHLVAERGNPDLWKIAVQRPDCDLNARDSYGNTPLMRAVICKSDKLIEAWLKDKSLVAKVDLTLTNGEGKTLLMLFLEHSSMRMFRLFLNSVNARDCVNMKDYDGHTALLQASVMGKTCVSFCMLDLIE